MPSHPSRRFFFTVEFSHFLDHNFLEKKCQKFVIHLSFFAWFFPVLVSHNQVAFIFNFGHMLHITAFVPRAFGQCALLRTVLRTEVSMFFVVAMGARLQATALRAVHQTPASVLREGTQRLSLEGGALL